MTAGLTSWWPSQSPYLKDVVVNYQVTSYRDNELTGALVHNAEILQPLLEHLPSD